MPLPSWLETANALPIIQVAAALGISVRHGDLECCPYCGVARRGSGRIFARRPQQVFKCFRCNKGGDVVDLVAVVLTGEKLGRSREQAHTVQNWFAENASGIPSYEPEEAQERYSYPPDEEVDAFKKRLRHVSRTRNVDVVGYLRSRNYDLHMIPAATLDLPYPKPNWWPHPWEQDFPVLIQAFDFSGKVRSFHGISVDRKRTGRKTTWPRGYSSGGLLLLDPSIARPIVSGTLKEPRRILLVEGATDFLTACQASQEAREASQSFGVVGIESGCFGALSAVLWPVGTTFFMDMDPDAAGDRYEKKIASALTPHPLRRLPKRGDAHGNR